MAITIISGDPVASAITGEGVGAMGMTRLLYFIGRGTAGIATVLTVAEPTAGNLGYVYCADNETWTTGTSNPAV